jgi:hypothetical protein
MTRMRVAIAAAAMSGAMLFGGVIGATVFSMTAANAAAPAAAASPSPGASSGSGGSPSAGQGTFTPNEDPTHEAGESAAREAQENAGQRPTVP